MADESEAVVVRGLAFTAVALAERHQAEGTALLHLREFAEQMGACTAPVFRAAAAAVAELPQPPLESAEETERAREERKVRGRPSAEDQLSAALQGREWLARLADELE